VGEVLRAEVEMLGGGERIVVCHSLACALWLGHCEQPGDARPVDRVLLRGWEALMRTRPKTCSREHRASLSGRR